MAVVHRPSTGPFSGVLPARAVIGTLTRGRLAPTAGGIDQPEGPRRRKKNSGGRMVCKSGNAGRPNCWKSHLSFRMLSYYRYKSTTINPGWRRWPPRCSYLCAGDGGNKGVASNQAQNDIPMARHARDLALVFWEARESPPRTGCARAACNVVRNLAGRKFQRLRVSVAKKTVRGWRAMYETVLTGLPVFPLHAAAMIREKPAVGQLGKPARDEAHAGHRQSPGREVRRGIFIARQATRRLEM